MSENSKTKNEVEEVGEEKLIYELGYHLIPTLEGGQITEEVSNIKSLLEKEGGVFIMEELPASIRFAYTMERRTGGKREKYNAAHFGWIKFELIPLHIKKIKEALEANNDVLRFLIIKTVREDTRSAGRMALIQSAEAKEEITIAKKAPVRQKETPAKISEEELDRTIEELVVE